MRDRGINFFFCISFHLKDGLAGKPPLFFVPFRPSPTFHIAFTLPSSLFCAPSLLLRGGFPPFLSVVITRRSDPPPWQIFSFIHHTLQIQDTILQGSLSAPWHTQTPRLNSWGVRTPVRASEVTTLWRYTNMLIIIYYYYYYYYYHHGYA